MQLKLKRSMEMKGLISKNAVYSLNFRADYTEDEREDINKYNLGGEVLLHKEKLNITIKSLKDGHHIECVDLNELLQTEAQVHGVCKNLKNYLDMAKTFDGRVDVVEF